jgi:hypothetical protein
MQPFTFSKRWNLLPPSFCLKNPALSIDTVPEIISWVVTTTVAGQLAPWHVEGDADSIPVGIVIARHHLSYCNRNKTKLKKSGINSVARSS